MRKVIAYVLLGICMAGFVVAHVLRESDDSAVYLADTPSRRDDSASYPTDTPSRRDDSAVPQKHADDSRVDASQPPAADPAEPRLQPEIATTPHPLLAEENDVVLAAADEVRSTAGPRLSEIIRALVGAGRDTQQLAELTIDYPLDESIVPPEIISPTFLWHESAEKVDTWLIDVAFANDSGHIYALSPGRPPPAGKIDPECVSKTNEIHKPTPYQASARSWTPSEEVWDVLKRRSSGVAAEVTITGFSSDDPAKPVSRGRMTITTSKDPIGAPIFYRDVPLMPSETVKGTIKPLAKGAQKLIAWRLRDISKPESRLLMTDIPSCANCHSFSADGKTLAMDLDGPSGDRGAYVIAPVSKEMVIEDEYVISWNYFKDKPKGHKTIGFLSQISPDGQYAVTTLNESVYVANFLDYKFLQVFYPTRGILAYYSKATDEMKALPGADDTDYVHCDPVWTPDGKDLVFARAKAMDPYVRGGKLAEYAGDPAERRIRYDLFRMPFNGGKGGKPEPIAGASDNGMSNTFPKVSPDGKWIVFVKCRNGQLMRPDSTLWILPLAGGEARLMRCNTRLMNSWHSFSPNSRWLVFSSKVNTPYTQAFLTHIDENGNDSPPILISNCTAANRAVNIPEFMNIRYDELISMTVPATNYLKFTDQGLKLIKKGMLDEAVTIFSKVVELQPDYQEGQLNLGVALLEKGRLDEAITRFHKVLELNANHAEAHSNLGIALAKKGMLDKAIVQFDTALKLKPDYWEAHGNLGRALSIKGRLDEAIDRYKIVLTLNPGYAQAHIDLGLALAQKNRIRKAVEHYRKALEIDPGLIDARLLLGGALLRQEKFKPAAAQFQGALETAPDNLGVMIAFAWLLATCPEQGVRDGTRAIELAERACTITKRSDPKALATLAAAYAEAGKFTEAVATATRALNLAEQQRNNLARSIRQHLQLYKAGKPQRDRR